MRGAYCMFAGHPGGKLLRLGVAAALDLAEAFCLDDVVSSVLTAGVKQDIAIQCHFACCHDLNCNSDVCGQFIESAYYLVRQGLLYLPGGRRKSLVGLLVNLVASRFFIQCLVLLCGTGRGIRFGHPETGAKDWVYIHLFHKILVFHPHKSRYLLKCFRL